MLGLGGGEVTFFRGGGGGNWKLHFSDPPLKTMVKGVGIFQANLASSILMSRTLQAMTAMHCCNQEKYTN